MSFRPSILMSLYCLFMACACGNTAQAQQCIANYKAQGMMSISAPSGCSSDQSMDSREIFLQVISLESYEAAVTDLSLCAKDKRCLRHAVLLKSWSCAANVCNGMDKSLKPFDCFKKDADEYYSKEVIDQTNKLTCKLINSPTAEMRHEMIKLLPDELEDSLVENLAYLMAIKGNAASCESYIKNYVGPYGPAWKFQWYRALSGCRILARENTLKQEEKDFNSWFEVVQGSGRCSDIGNVELRDACQTPGATPPTVVKK